MRKLLAVIFIVVAVVSTSAWGVVIDFDSLTGSEETLQNAPYVEEGFILTTDWENRGINEGKGKFWSIHNDSYFYAESVSFATYYTNDFAVLTRQGGGTFNLISIDLDSLYSGGSIVEFTGMLEGGGIVTQTFTTDFNRKNMETFVFIGFDNLVSVSWDDNIESSTLHHYDNIVVNTGHEPSKQSVYIDMTVPIHSGYGIYELDSTTGEILHYFDPSGATSNVGNLWIEGDKMYSIRGNENAIYVTDLSDRKSSLLSSHEMINAPHDIIITESGDILLVNDFGREILSLDPVSGAYKGIFADPPERILELHQGPDGNLYALSGIASTEETVVQVLDPNTGALQRTFATPYSFTIGFVTDGSLLTASREEVGSDLFRYDATTGIQQMVYGEPFDLPTSISVGPDGMIWVSDFGDHLVYLLDPSSYFQVDTFDADSVSGSSQLLYDLAFGPPSQAPDTNISEHVHKIEISTTTYYHISHGYVPYYGFDAGILVDETVTSGTVQIPTGDVYPLMLEEDEPERWFSFYAEGAELADLFAGGFTSGIYTFTVNYSNDGSDSTSVNYALPNGDPIPYIDQKPSFLYPLHNDTDIPLSIALLFEPALNPDWTISLDWEPEPEEDDGLKGEVEFLPYDTTSYGPVILSPNQKYEFEIGFNNVVDTVNADKIWAVMDTDNEFDIHATTTSDTIQNPIALLEQLIQQVIDLNLHHGTENSLLAKLNSTIKALEKGNEKTTINSLKAFIHSANAQSGKKITEDDASDLIASAQYIIDVLDSD